MSNSQLEPLLADEPEDVQAEILRINKDARNLSLQVALLVPLLAGLLGVLNAFRMRRLPGSRAGQLHRRCGPGLSEARIAGPRVNVTRLTREVPFSSPSALASPARSRPSNAKKGPGAGRTHRRPDRRFRPTTRAGRSRRYPPRSSIPSRLLRHGRKRRQRLLVPPAAERRERGRGHRRLLDRQPLVLLEQPSSHRTANRDRRAGSWRATSAVSASASSSDSRPSSRAVASAMATLPRSIARLKIALGCPCAVTALPVGPDGEFRVWGFSSVT